MEKPDQLIARYMHLHSLMQGLDKAIATLDARMWKQEVPSDVGLQGVGFDAHEPLQMASFEFSDSLGDRRTMVVGRSPKDAGRYMVWMSEPNAERVQSEGQLVTQAPNGKLAVEHAGLSIYNDRFMYDHQARAVQSYGTALVGRNTQDTSREVTVFATGTGKSYIIAHTLKAMGGEGVVVAPAGLGGQIANEIAEVIPPASRIRLSRDIPGDGQQLAKQLEGFKGIMVIESDDLERFVGSEAKPGWLCAGPRKHVSIDEAHELTGGSPVAAGQGADILRRIAAHNDVMAVTATPTPELYEALGIADAKPAISMTMYDAMHRLADRPFRPMSLEMRQVGEPQSVHAHDATQREAVQKANESAVRMEALAGYFGREEYITPDYYRQPGQGWNKRGDLAERYAGAEHEYRSRLRFNAAVPQPKDMLDTHAECIVEAMEQNRLRFSAHKNIAFAVRNGLVKNLARDFQSIHDDTYEGIETLTAEVWKRRAQSAIAEYIRMYKRSEGFGLPEELEDFLKQQQLSILMISDKNLADTDNQQAYREAVRRIEPEQFAPYMPILFSRLIGTAQDIDLTQEARQAAANTARAAALRSHAADVLHISGKEARRLDIAGKLEARLRQGGFDPDTVQAAPGEYYALAVLGDEPGKESVFDMRDGKKLDLTADDVAQLVRDGKVMHVVNNYRFATGFSDPDVMMTQRIVENVGDHVIRATQILGRPIREKDGVAAIHEIVGPYINLQGNRGADRHFSCYDVVDKAYLDHAAEFASNWQAEGRGLWQPSTTVEQTREASRVDPAAKGHAR